MLTWNIRKSVMIATCTVIKSEVNDGIICNWEMIAGIELKNPIANKARISN